MTDPMQELGENCGWGVEAVALAAVMRVRPGMPVIN